MQTILKSTDTLIIAAGAGMGLDSGLPDFRGTEGFWHAYPALAQAKLDFSRIANPDAFVKHPLLARGFYGHRLALYRVTQSHLGFSILKRWAGEKPNGWAVFTSNVDGQFQKAGFHGGPVHECHGSIHFLQCLESCCDDVWPANDFHPVVDEAQCMLLNEPPHCPRCGGLARPNIAMFNDWGWVDRRSARQEVELEPWLQQCKNPLVIELEAGTAIASVRAFSFRMGLKWGARLIRINPWEHVASSPNDVGLPMGALAGLQHLDDLWMATRPRNNEQA